MLAQGRSSIDLVRCTLAGGQGRALVAEGSAAIVARDCRIAGQAAQGRLRRDKEARITVEGGELRDDDRMARAMARLDALVGLAGVKREIDSLVHLVNAEKRRKQAGLEGGTVTLNLVFQGLPRAPARAPWPASAGAHSRRHWPAVESGHLIEADSRRPGRGVHRSPGTHRRCG